MTEKGKMECWNEQNGWRKIPYYQQFVEFSPCLVELLTDPYYNKFAPEGIGVIKKKYYGGKKNEKPKGKNQH
jgi:hypothetical protein